MHFSVFVPCFDPDPAQLAQALDSVVSQLDRRRNQVVVFDDRSADPSVCARAAERARVTLVRPDAELGGVRTHNACFAMAEHELIHVCHPDDYVLRGFYDSVAAAAALRPDVALYAAHCLTADRDGRVFQAPRPDWQPAGPRSFLPLHEGNPLCVCACVLRRSWLDASGGWDERLFHTADWECWVRAATQGGAFALDWPLAVFRAHPGNHTNRLARSARNLRNYLALADVVRGYAPELVDDAAFRAYVARRAREQERAFRKAGELTAAAANEQLARELGG